MNSAQLNARKAVEAAMKTFITDTTPGAFLSLAATLQSARDGGDAMMAGAPDAEQRFYRAIVQYSNEIIAREQNVDTAVASKSLAAPYPFP